VNEWFEGMLAGEEALCFASFHRALRGSAAPIRQI
jgi:hypothetical protein